MSEQVKTDICTSTAKIKFSNILNQTRLTSEHIKVPEIDGVWWIEVYQMGLVPYTDLTPEIKITMQINNQHFIDSKLLRATINLKEVSFMVFDNYTQTINSKKVEIDTASSDCRSRSSLKKYPDAIGELFKIYQSQPSSSFSHLNMPCRGKQSFHFDCSITFQYGLQSAKELLSSQERILNLETFASLFEDDKYADFTFVIQGKEFKVHKCLLASVSSVFDVMFTSGLDETKNNSVDIDCKPEVFKVFLEFIYKNTFPLKDFPTSNYFSLYQLAHCYNIAPLMEICLAVIMDKKVDSSNALDLYEFAGAYDVKELKQTTWKFIKFEMLNIREECEAKPLEQIKLMLQKIRQFEEDRRSFIA